MGNDIKEILVSLTKLETKVDCLTDSTKEIESLKKEFQKFKNSVAKLVSILTGAGISITFMIWIIEHYKDIKIFLHV